MRNQIGSAEIAVNASRRFTAPTSDLLRKSRVGYQGSGQGNVISVPFLDDFFHAGRVRDAADEENGDFYFGLDGPCALAVLDSKN
jgi:hypothetical protein